jgi:Zn-dependent protease with chaperone function
MGYFSAIKIIHMPGHPFPYPTNPSSVPPAITEPSAAFKRQVARVLGAIILFLFVYLLMLSLSLVLVGLSLYGGIAIMTSLRGLWAILGGLGVMGLGVMVFVFLIKFLFAVSKFDESGSVEVTEEEQPELFAFVRQIATDTQAPFPKKILLSADVNAAVFYNSSFWSMFFPVRKNLLIGLGLVNTLNLSEFKAVIAHEFGHFSQRSMKLGSFVYNVNRIIYNMLYENKSYGSAIEGWAQIHGIFALFASITIAIARGIQWVLQQMYGVINKSYMALSREMEFHADAVAASVSGSSSLITALRRVELGQLSYSTALEKCDELLREKKYSNNIFGDQRVVLKQLMSEFKLSEQNGLPVVNDEFLTQRNVSRLNVKDQWASHPSLEDREKHLNGLAVPAETNENSAWIVFRENEQWKEKLTKLVYRNTKLEAEMMPLAADEFESWFQRSISDYNLPEEYNGYYDGRFFHLPTEEEEKDLLLSAPVSKTFEEIYSASNAGLFRQIQSATADLQMLKAIASKEYPVKTFDFDGVKYDSSEAADIAARVESELNGWTAALRQNDIDSVRYFISYSGESEKLAALYSEYFQLRRQADLYLTKVNETLGALSPLFNGEIKTEEAAHAMVSRLKTAHEPEFKRKVDHWLHLGAFDHDTALKQLAEKFIKSDYVYFAGSSFFDNELEALDELGRQSWLAISGLLFRKFKYILQQQLEHVEKRAA